MAQDPKRFEFWNNFHEYIKVNSCRVEITGVSSQPKQTTYVKGYDLQIDLCANKGTRKNKWNTRVELYGQKTESQKEKQIKRCIYFESQLAKMRNALPDYEIDFRIVSPDKASWKLYIGTNDLIYEECKAVEIYEYYLKAINRMVEAFEVFFQPYKK